MTRFITRAAFALIVFNAGRAVAQVVARDVRLAAVAGHSVINEVQGLTDFYFERCRYDHVGNLNVLNELAAHAFTNCRRLGAAHPIAHRTAALTAIDDALAARRRELGDPNVLTWTLQGGFEGFVIGGLGYVATRRLVVPRRYPLEKAWRDLSRVGAVTGLATGFTRMRRARARRGQHAELLEVFDPSLPKSMVLLDQRTDDAGVQRRAMDLVAELIDQTLAR